MRRQKGQVKGWKQASGTENGGGENRLGEGKGGYLRRKVVRSRKIVYLCMDNRDQDLVRFRAKNTLDINPLGGRRLRGSSV